MCLGRLRVKEQNIVRHSKPDRGVVRLASASLSLPNDLIPEVLQTENRIQDRLQIVARRRIAMQVKGACALEHSMDFNNAPRHAYQVGQQTSHL